MNRIILTLAMMVAAVLGKEPFEFPMEGTVRIEAATYYLNGDRTGGSVSVVLRDAKGIQSFVHYMTQDAGPEDGGGLLKFRVTKSDKGTTFLRGSEDEVRLLNILRAACVASFGSSDPAFLKEPSNWPGKKDGFDRMAMASLLRHFPTKAEQSAVGKTPEAPQPPH